MTKANAAVLRRRTTATLLLSTSCFLLATAAVMLFLTYKPHPFMSIIFPSTSGGLSSDLADVHAEILLPADRPPPPPPPPSCDIFKGRWVREPELMIIENDDDKKKSPAVASAYSDKTCPTLPETKNCARFGKSSEPLNWRWKPEGCELLEFDAGELLRLLRGKRIAFIGDSVARNQLDSLLCLMSQAEVPTEVFKDEEGRRGTWRFNSTGTTVTALWSKFLVESSEREVNGTLTGSFDLRVNRVDPAWAAELPRIDVAVVSSGHWFFRRNYIHDEGGKLIGCTFCSGEGVKELSIAEAVRLAFRTALRAINGDRSGEAAVAILRTFSPAHFENGTWNEGGRCDRESPLAAEEAARFGTTHLEIRDAQVDEASRASEASSETAAGGRWRFRVMDVSEVAMWRADGHPGSHWNKEWMEGHSDCIHWCLPGPIDVWNQLLLELLRRG